MIAHAAAIKLRSVRSNAIASKCETQNSNLGDSINAFVGGHKGGVGTSPGIYPSIGVTRYNEVSLVGAIVGPFHDFNFSLFNSVGWDAEDGDNLLSGETYKLSAEAFVVTGCGTRREEKTDSEKGKGDDTFHHAAHYTPPTGTLQEKRLVIDDQCASLVGE